MGYLLLFLEGILTFISPCLLPMIPLYVAYLVGNSESNRTKWRTLFNALLFVAGFTVVFLAINLFVSSVGQFVIAHRRLISILAGVWMVILGVDFLLDSRLISKLTANQVTQLKTTNPFVFGIIFSISWTPCVGTFLAGALTQAALADNLWHSTSMLLAYCMGLGLPFIVTAIMIQDLQQTLNTLKRHLRFIKRISAYLLIAIGFLMIFGLYDYLIFGMTN